GASTRSRPRRRSNLVALPITTPAVIGLEFGKPLIVEDVIVPDPGPMQIIVKQFASGVCHSQLHRLSNEKQSRPSLLGHESTGVVAAKGKDVSYLKEGDRVMISLFPRDARPGMLPHQTPMVKFRGQDLPATFGGHTWMETVISDERWCVKLDDGVPPDVAAVVGCAVLTGAGAVLNTAKVQVGNSVAVYGVGGLGLCTVQACANVGAYPIIAVDVADDKLEYARHFGASHTVNSAKEDPVAKIKEITAGGADFAFDVIGVPQTMSQIVLSVRAGAMAHSEGGSAVLVGVPHGGTPSIPIGDLSIGAKKFMGCWGGTGNPERDFPMYVRWFKEGKMPLDKLVTRRYRLEDVNEACRALKQGEILGRAILTFR
ncbi:MAG: zinc-binding dehydrogenase, partial [Chloroflexota bacterium]|nr:zinc-binding dehydrogenase [Chloroflexota bacterium]